jgi:hypothetical protein
MRRSRSALRLEALEDRTVPSLTASFISGSLTLSGYPRGELDIVHTGPNAGSFQVTDSGSNVGTFNILANVTLNLTYRLSDINLDLKGGTIPGNVAINLGNGLIGSGTPGVNVYDDSAGATGRISGNLSFGGGNGHEILDVGSITGLVGTDPITVRGNLSASATNSSGTFGNMLIVDAGTRVGGSLTSTLMSSVAIGSSTTGSALTSIGLGLSISDANSLRALSAVVTASVGGNVNVTGTILDDSFALQTTLTPGSGTVAGTLTVNLNSGQGNGELITLGDRTQVNGSASLTVGGNFAVVPDQINVGGSVFSNLTVNTGDGLNSLRFTQQQVGDPAPLVGGTMTVNGGNGSNSLFLGADVTGDAVPVIGQDLHVTLGNGNNGMAGVPNIIAAAVGGTIYWQSGNGQDFVQLGNFSSDGNSESYNVQMVFGSDDDSLSVDIGAGTLTGSADGGGGTNTFVVITGTVAATFTSSNF